MNRVHPVTKDSLAVLAAREALDEYDAGHPVLDMLTWEGRMTTHLRRLVGMIEESTRDPL